MSFMSTVDEQISTGPVLSSRCALILAIRPSTLMIGLAPVLIGLSLAFKKRGELALQGGHPLLMAIASILLVLLLQMAANLVNDAKDAERGVDGQSRLGPMRVVQSGIMPAAVVRWYYRLCFALAASIILMLFGLTGDWLIPIVALSAALVAYAYTGGPFPLAYFALGELVAGVFFGPVAVLGTVYLQTAKLDWNAAIWGLGSGCIAAAIMAINNFRDRDGDRQAGKRTLANLMSSSMARQFPLFLSLSSLSVLVIYGQEHQKLGIAIPWALLGLMFIRRRIVPSLAGEAEQLNQALKFTAFFHLFYAFLFASLVLL